MSRAGPALAKLTRPKLYDALPRPRLFSLLDEAVDAADRLGVRAAGRGQDDARRELSRGAGPAPPLVPGRHRATATPRRSSITCGRRRCSSSGKKAASLPHFKPEPQQDLARFARTYFREFFLGAAAAARSSCSTTSTKRARRRSCAAPSRTRWRKSRKASPSSRSRAAIRRPSSRGSSRAGASRASSPRRSRCTPEEAEAMLAGSELDARGRCSASRGRATAGWRRSCCCAST